MTPDDKMAEARDALRQALTLLQDDIRSYPTPISGCDAQFNHLVGLRSSVQDALGALDGPRFVATPRTPFPNAGVESR